MKLLPGLQMQGACAWSSTRSRLHSPGYRRVPSSYLGGARIDSTCQMAGPLRRCDRKRVRCEHIDQQSRPGPIWPGSPAGRMVPSAPLLSTPSVKPHSRHAGPASGRAHPAWSSERLSAALASSFATESVVVLANRQPFSHDWMPGQGIAVSRSSGGLVTALEPVMRACSGTWVAHGTGTADRPSSIAVIVCGCRRQHRRTALRRVWLNGRGGARLLLRVCQRRPLAALP